MDKPTRNTLRNTVTQCRRLLEAALGQELAGRFGIYATGAIDDAARMGHLSTEEREYREQLLVHLEHIRAGGFKSTDAVAQLVRGVSFTHLNRLVAYKMMEARGLIREAVSRGPKSQGFLFYLADHPTDEALWSGGQADLAYRHFLTNLGATFVDEIPALFSQTDPANRLYPPQRTLDEVLALINGEELAGIWGEDETIGWVYQYFTPKELRDQARKESQAPRNSYELAFRNQFYTPRYVVEFLSDNTLGRIWYEMRQGQTALAERCRYMVRRPVEVFLAKGETHRRDAEDREEGLSQEALLKRPVYISYREKKDPREILMLDPAGGSGHFGLYCFDLYEIIYEEAYDDPDLGKRLRADYPDRGAYRRAIPGLILAHNIHIIDIDPRACQIAALALWLRAQRAYQDMGLKPIERPAITKANVVCAEPMPGERELLAEFTAVLDPPVLGQLVAEIFDKMKLAGEAGSLLKIEEEIKQVIAQARKQWIEGPPKQLALLPDAVEAEPVQLTIFDLSGIDDEAFWVQAEGQVLDALRGYAEHAAGRAGLRRRLFADDAARGFAFIDLCRKRYDVTLMNPPFGWGIPSAKAYQERAYPYSKNDLYCSFVERMIEVSSVGGLVGSLTSRTGFFLSSMKLWRQHILLDLATVRSMADLGFGVLDNAFVETAAFVLQKGKLTNPMVSFYRLNESSEKDKDLEYLVRHDHGYFLPESDLRQLPGNPFSYWISTGVRQLFKRLSSLEKSGVTVAVGLATSDNERFLRLRWEVVPGNSRWIAYPKGGDFAKFHQDIYLLVDWENEGEAIKSQVARLYGSASRFVQNTALYGRAGLTYPRVSVKGFTVRILAENCIFSDVGQGIFSDAVNQWFLLGLLNSRTVEYLMRSFTPSRKWEAGFLKKIPLPQCDIEVENAIGNLARKLHDSVLWYDLADETTCRFECLPTGSGGRSLDSWIAAHVNLEQEAAGRITELGTSLNKATLSAYGLVDTDVQLPQGIENEIGGISEGDSSEEEELVDNGQLEQPPRIELVQRLLSYCLGCAFGRWDIRIGLVPALAPKSAEPFEPLPVCSPGTLLDPNGLPATPGRIVSEAWLRARPDAITLPPSGAVAQPTIPDSEYPLRIDWDGILADDPDHPDDIVRRVRDVLDLLWGERAGAIEQEACGILGVSELRDYFRKPAAGGFWLDHVRRYSKSRRKAPIYWLLQSSKKSYSLWLYYHRLDEDLLFKALVNYVEPKIRLEEGKLEGLRAQRAAAGTSGREAKQLERQLDRQEAFLAELHDFRDKLRRAADLGLEPDLNDGVILNIAPLWELVPWKEAKATWEELLAGKYEWSAVGKQLRAKGLVR